MHTSTRWAAHAEQPANFPDLRTLKQMQIDQNTTPNPESCDPRIEARLVVAARDSDKLGIRMIDLEFNVKDVMQRTLDAIVLQGSAEARGT
jgi:hypothetical protein